MTRPLRVVALLAATVCALSGVACGGGGSSGSDALKGDKLDGLFAIRPGECHPDGSVTGSTFQMVNPGGKVGVGPYVPNGDAGCGANTTTPLAVGSDGGLKTGAYQPQPTPVFEAGTGNGLSHAITAPTKFFAVNFALATNAKDPQTGKKTPVPTVVLNGTKLTANLSALGVAWNGQHFNQGSPKPGGNAPYATGTYNPTDKTYTLDWTSKIIGGPFNNFTGVWHLEGSFNAA